MMLLPTVQLKTEPAEGLRNGFMTRADTEAVLALLREVKPTRVLEIGINYGDTAREILQRVPGIHEYVGIDIMPGTKLPMRFQWPEIPLFPGREVKSDRRVKVIVRPNGSRDVTPEEIGKVDAVIIDGDHSEQAVLEDTRLALRCINPRGVIIWHDYYAETNTDVPKALHRLHADSHFRDALRLSLRWVEGTAIAFTRT